MRLNHISLRNYKQHTELEQDIEGNIIVVVGPNGRGKSNLMGAFNFALSGEQPGSTREDLLQWGTSAGKVVLDITHDGTDGCITRNLHNNSATFTFGTDDYNGIKPVAGALYEHLGWDKDLGKQSVFIQQAKLDSILFNDPRERELTFQRLMGIQHANKVDKTLGTFLSTWSTPPNYDEQIAEGSTRHSELKTRLQGLQDELKKGNDKRATCRSPDDLQSRLNTLSGFQTTLTRHTAISQHIVDIVTRLDKSLVDLKALKIPDIDVATLDTQITELQTVIEAAEAYQRVAFAYKHCGELIIALGDVPHSQDKLTELSNEVEQLNVAFSAANTELQLRAELLQTLKKQVQKELVECPLCGSEILDSAMVQARLSATVDKLRGDAQASNPRTKAEEYNLANLAVNSYTTQHGILMGNFKRIEAELNDAVNEGGDPAVLRDQARVMTEQRQAILAAISQKTHLEASINSDGDRLEQLRAESSELDALLEKQGLPKLLEAICDGNPNDAACQAQKYINDTQRALEEINELDQHLAKINGMVELIKESIDKLGSTIAALEDRRSNQSARGECLETLTNVRNWFNYKNGPRTMAASVLNDMTGDVNDFLGHFAAPFTVYPSEEAFGYRYIKHDGSPMSVDPPDAKHLSGGERIQLAISFRFATYCMFTNKLGLLSLDEPTVYLDDRNVGRFCSLMEKIKGVAKSMDLQILIATHERSIVPFADTVVDLGEVI